MHAPDGVTIVELDLALVDVAGDRRRAHGVGHARERDVAFPGKEPRGRIELDPAGARVSPRVGTLGAYARTDRGPPRSYDSAAGGITN